MSSIQIGKLDATTNSNEWEFRSINFTSPPNADQLPVGVTFWPYGLEGGAYPGVDAVSLTSFGAVAQSLETEVGQRYHVTFDVAGDATSGPAARALLVSAAGTSQLFEVDVTKDICRGSGLGEDDMGIRGG